MTYVANIPANKVSEVCEIANDYLVTELSSRHTVEMHPVHRYRKLTEVNTLLGMVCQHVRVPDRRTTSVAHCGSSALIEKKTPLD